MTIDESIYPSINYLESLEKCYGSKGTGFTKYYADTSFVRTPTSCQCFNGKYFGFNDSIRLKYFWTPIYWDRFYRFLGRKYWSPVTGSTGISKYARDEIYFNVYPNPSAGKVSLLFENGYLPKNRKGIICDINGKTVMEFEMSDTGISSVISTDNLPSGVYIVKLQDHERAFVKRFVIAK